MPNYLIQWEMMKEAKKRGCTMYDFGGISGISHLIILFGVFISSKKALADNFWSLSENSTRKNCLSAGC
ncbi:hypothetical protein B1222_00710 [Paenibacillus larvae subsp. pulvifaciens]|nr:hypothetical protein B1222_00710 [Paenibacillus larvae subsp. pulvifaciens]